MSYLGNLQMKSIANARVYVSDIPVWCITFKAPPDMLRVVPEPVSERDERQLIDGGCRCSPENWLLWR